MPNCMRCQKPLKMKSACICADCVRATMMPKAELDKLLKPKEGS